MNQIPAALIGTIPGWITSVGMISLFGLVLRFYLSNKKLNHDHQDQSTEAEQVTFNTILTEVRRQRDEAFAEVKDCQSRMDRMEVEITGLRIARDLDPFPNWIVTATDFTYLFVNGEFERLFLIPDGRTYRDIIGLRHEDLWPEPFCRTLYSLNEAAKSRPDGTARAKTTLDIPRIGQADVTVHKFPVRGKPSNVILGWAGYITSIEPAERTMG